MTLRLLAYGPIPESLPADTPVAEVLALMLARNFNHVALRDGDGRYAGLVSARALLAQVVPASARVEQGLSDLAFAGDSLPMLLSHYRDLAQTSAASLAETGAPVLRGDTPLTETALLLSRSPTPLPVLDADGRLVGVVSPRTLLAFLAAQVEKGEKPAMGARG